MARLSHGGLALDVSYVGYADGTLEYAVSFLWHGISLINAELLRRDGEYWGTRVGDAFKTNEHDGDTLISILEEVLSTNRLASWTTHEPDLQIVFYPDFFPFFGDPFEELWEIKDLSAEQRAQHLVAFSQGHWSPDALMTIIAYVDTYNLVDSGGYSFDGPALVLCTKRSGVEQFLADLRREYADIRARYHVED